MIGFEATDAEYTMLSAQIMGWGWDPDMGKPFYESNGDSCWICNWEPLKSRDQSYTLLKMMEQKNLIDNVVIELRQEFDNPLAFSCPSLWLMVSTESITKACVRALVREQNQGQKGNGENE